ARPIPEAGRHIGEVLAGAVNLLNPEALVIAGDMSKAYDIFVAGLRETVYEKRDRTRNPRTKNSAVHPRRSVRCDRLRCNGSGPRAQRACGRCRPLTASVLPKLACTSSGCPP